VPPLSDPRVCSFELGGGMNSMDEAVRFWCMGKQMGMEAMGVRRDL
jgi:hypothetical protein